MAAKKKSAFSDASDAIIKAFHQLERAVMGTPAVKAATAKPAKTAAGKKAVKKRAVKTAKKTRKNRG